MNDLVVSLDSVLVVGTLDGLVHALNFSSGETIWSFNSGGRLVTSSTLLGAQPSLAHPVVVSGLDGTIFVFGEEEPLQLEHTIQELVASPTLYSERGVAVGSKSVRVAALDSLTGEPRYFYATPTTRADPLLAEDALPHEGGSSREPAGNASAPDGLLIVSRSDYHVEVRDGASGARRWAISLGEYTLALSPAAGHSHARAQEAPLRMRLTLIDHELCAATAGSSACTWSHAFSSPPVLLFHLDRASGAQEQLQFLTAAPLRAAHLSRPAPVPAEAPLAIAIAPQPQGASGVEAAGQLGERGEQRLAVSVQAGVAREAPPTRYRHPLLPLLPLLAQSLPPRAQGAGLLHDVARLAIEAGPSAGGAGRPLLAGSPPPPGTDAVAPWGTAAPTQLSRLAPALLEATTQELLQAVEGRVAASAARHARLILACALVVALLLCGVTFFCSRRWARTPPYERPADAGGLVGKGAARAAPVIGPSALPPGQHPPGPASSWARPSRYREEFDEGRRLGKGGFGRVFRARHKLDGVDYAVKKVLLTGSQHVQDRAVREAMCLAKLDHPNVVRYHQVWKEEVEESALEQFLDSSDEEDSSSLSLSRPTASRTHQSSSVRPSRSECGGALPARAVLYIQMQLCENTLREWMQTPGRDGSIGVNRGYFVQVLQGLAHIHQASLIHRDLTPNNVFITHDKTFKIGDFGLSREMTDADSLAAPLDPEHGAAQDALLQSVSRGVGTSLYMSPEQRGCCKVDYKADVYSAGVILLELCYPMSTHMERVVVLSALQRRELPRSLAGTAVGLLILRLTADSAAARPTVAALLSDELLSG